MILTKIYRSVAVLFALGFVTIATAKTNKNTIINQIQELSLKTMVMPVDLGTMTMDSVKVFENSLEYFNTFKDERTYTYYLLNNNELKKSLLSTYTQNGQNALSGLMCIDSGKDVKFHFQSRTGKSFTIIFHPSQLLSTFGITEITPEYRRQIVESSLLKATSSYEIGHKLIEINNTNFEAALYVERKFSKKEKLSLYPDIRSAFFSKDILSLFPLYALYLEKGYTFRIIEPKNKESKTLKYSYTELYDIFAYINKPRREELYDESPKPTTNSENAKQATKLDVQPTFNGGSPNEFAKWVNSRLVYPEMAKEHGIQGRVTLKFTIGKDGSVTNVKITKGVHPDLDEEAVRVVSSSPRWSPGILEGEPVPVTYTFPVILQLR